MGEAAQKLEANNEWQIKKVQVAGLTQNQRKKELEKKKQKMAAKGWEFVEYTDSGMSKSEATFRRPLGQGGDDKKNLIAGVVGLFVILGIIGSFMGEDSETPETESNQVQVSQSQPEAVKAKSKPVTEKKPTFITKEGTLERDIEVGFNGSRGRGLSSIQAIQQVAGRYEGKYLAKIEYEAQDGFSMKKNLMMDMRSIGQSIAAQSRSGEISEIMLMAYFSGTQVAKMVLPMETIKAMNWQQLMTSDIESLLQTKGSLWLHQDIR